MSYSHISSSYLAHMNMQFVLAINFKMPTLVGILKYMARTNDIVSCSEQENCLDCLYIESYKDCKSHAD